MFPRLLRAIQSTTAQLRRSACVDNSVYYPLVAYLAIARLHLARVHALGIPAHKLGLMEVKALGGKADSSALEPGSGTLLDTFTNTLRTLCRRDCGIAGIPPSAASAVSAAACRAVCALFAVAYPSPEQQLRQLSSLIVKAATSSTSAAVDVADDAIVRHYLPRLRTELFWTTLLVYGAPEVDADGDEPLTDGVTTGDDASVGLFGAVEHRDVLAYADEAWNRDRIASVSSSIRQLVALVTSADSASSAAADVRCNVVAALAAAQRVLLRELAVVLPTGPARRSDVGGSVGGQVSSGSGTLFRMLSSGRLWGRRCIGCTDRV